MARRLVVTLALLLAMAGEALQMHRAPLGGRTRLAAKQKKGKKSKKAGGQKKQAGNAFMDNYEVMPYDAIELRQLADLAANSYQSRCGKALDESLAEAGDVPKALYRAPIAVLVVADAAIAYANEAACEALGGKHGVVIGSPTVLAGKLGAKPFESKYEKKVAGVTMQKADRWAIERMAVADGALSTESVGVGYAFATWTRDDGSVCAPGGIVSAPPPDSGDLEARVAAQAALIRDLKENQGLENKSPEVSDAVAELLRLKSELEFGPPEDV